MNRASARWAALLLALLGACVCRSPAPSIQGAGPRVLLEAPSGRVSAVHVEVARTPEELERGLMFREKLGSADGMLFVFPQSAEHTFWMKNTLIPLDMVFIDEGHAVAGIVASAEPMTTTPRTVGVASRYVLEVNGGFCAAHGVTRGDLVRFESVDAP